MASYVVVDHSVFSLQHMYPQTLHLIPLHLIQTELEFQVRNNSTAVPFSTETFSFPFDLLLNHALFDDFLATTLESLGINADSPDCGRIVQQIMKLGFDIVTEYEFHCECVHLKAEIIVDMSRSDFESGDYVIVAATPSSVKHMIQMITVEEDGGKQNCVVCLEELVVGSEASRMPCSHIFHGDCIGTWLKQGHSCPICRYEMPTMTDQTDR